MKTSQQGLDLIKHFEGFEPKPYVCSAGKITIGYGHVILPGEDLTVLTQAEALALLARDMEKFEALVHMMVTVDLTQNQFDALVSFCYNCGPANLQKSTLLKHVNANNPERAAGEFKKWVFAAGKRLRGLERRREAEKKLFRGEAWNG